MEGCLATDGGTEFAVRTRCTIEGNPLNDVVELNETDK